MSATKLEVTTLPDNPNDTYICCGELLAIAVNLPPLPSCSRCGSPRTVELVYGFPDPLVLEAVRHGLLRLGGFPRDEDPPTGSCLDCGASLWEDERWQAPVWEDWMTPEGFEQEARALRALHRSGLRLGLSDRSPAILARAFACRHAAGVTRPSVGPTGRRSQRPSQRPDRHGGTPVTLPVPYEPNGQPGADTCPAR